jgi:hypothetical protein
MTDSFYYKNKLRLLNKNYKNFFLDLEQERPKKPNDEEMGGIF